MTKTSLFVEILVIGYMGCAWLAMLMIAILGPPTSEVLLGVQSAFRDAQIPATFGLTAFAYFLGILIDQIADTVMGIWDRRIRIALEQGGSPPLLDMQAYIFTRVSESSHRYDYIQKRLRISRASVFNVGAIVVLVPFVGLGNTNVLLIILVGAGIWASTVFSYYQATRFYWKRIGREYRALADREPDPAEPIS